MDPGMKESFANTAAMVAEYYSQLLSQGFSDKEALVLATNWQEVMLKHGLNGKE